MNEYITEIIPDLDKLPDWAREAFEDGQYFNVVSEKVIAYEATIKELEKDLVNYEAELETAEYALDDANDAAVIDKGLAALEAIIKAQNDVLDKVRGLPYKWWHESTGKGINAYYVICADELQSALKPLED